MAVIQVAKAKKSKKQRKHGRGNRIGGQCSIYKLQRRRERNKVRKITKHIKRYGANDKVAHERLQHYKIVAGIK